MFLLVIVSASAQQIKYTSGSHPPIPAPGFLAGSGNIFDCHDWGLGCYLVPRVQPNTLQCTGQPHNEELASSECQ